MQTISHNAPAHAPAAQQFSGKAQIAQRIVQKGAQGIKNQAAVTAKSRDTSPLTIIVNRDSVNVLVDAAAEL